MTTLKYCKVCRLTVARHHDEEACLENLQNERDSLVCVVAARDAEVKRLRVFERQAAGQQRCEACRCWFDLSAMDMDSEGVWLCKTCDGLIAAAKAAEAAKETKP